MMLNWSKVGFFVYVNEAYGSAQSKATGVRSTDPGSRIEHLESSPAVWLVEWSDEE